MLSKSAELFMYKLKKFTPTPWQHGVPAAQATPIEVMVCNITVELI